MSIRTPHLALSKARPRYPTVFITVELQTAFLVATGAVALFSFYYSVSSDDFLKILAVTLGLTAVGVGFVLARVLKRLRPLKAWLAGDRDPPSRRRRPGTWP